MNILFHVTGLRISCCLSPFVFILYPWPQHRSEMLPLKVLQVNVPFCCPHRNRPLCHFGACCKLKNPSEVTGERKEESLMRALKQHMLLPCTSTHKTGFYFTLFPSITQSAPPLLNSQLPIFGKSLRVFDKDRLKQM